MGPQPARVHPQRALPAKVGNIELDVDAGEARVNVGSDQLSLAIGKGGQNVRLAAKLSGFKIDLVATESISDLDAAMAAAASRQQDLGTAAPTDSRRAAFDALFATPKRPKPRRIPRVTRRRPMRPRRRPSHDEPIPPRPPAPLRRVPREPPEARAHPPRARGRAG